MIPPSHISSRALTKSREQTFLRVLTLNLYTHVSSVSRLCKKKEKKRKKPTFLGSHPWHVLERLQKKNQPIIYCQQSGLRTCLVSTLSSFFFFLIFRKFDSSSSIRHEPLTLNVLSCCWNHPRDVGEKRRQSLQKYCVTICITIILFSSDGFFWILWISGRLITEDGDYQLPLESNQWLYVVRQQQ